MTGAWSMTDGDGDSGYDALNRLVAAQATAGPYYSSQAPIQATWSYDSFGNRKTENFTGTPSGSMPIPPSSSVNYSTNNQVTSVNGGSGFTYDASGDVMQDTDNQYLDDAEGRVCASLNRLDGAMTGYLYDAEGNRVAKGPIGSWSCDTSINGFGSTGSDSLYILSPGGEQLTEMTWSGGVAQFGYTNVSAAGQLIASYTPNGSQVALSFQLRDWLGTLRAETDYARNVQEKCESLPYGNGETCVATAPYLFTAKERDSESGNDYFGARYYASSMGRWISPDPSGQYFANPENPQTWNLYAYVANNPLINVDPMGLWVWSMGNCYFDTVASYVTAGGTTEFQGYDTQMVGCLNSTSSPQQQPQQPPQPPQQPQQPQQPKIDCSKPPPMPPTPPGANVGANEQATKKHGFGWWLMQVRPGGNWDYKKGGQDQYASFGNVNYGATCNTGLGEDLTFCQRGAGAAAYATATANVVRGESWTAGPGNPIGSPANNNGMPDYGDQATGTENQSVIAGFGYAQWQKACGKQ